MPNPTAKLDDYTIVEVVEEFPTTAKIRILTSSKVLVKRVNRKKLLQDPIIPLTNENAKEAYLVLNIKQMHLGVRKFNYLSQGGGLCHSVGTGAKEKTLIDSQMNNYRVIKFR